MIGRIKKALCRRLLKIDWVKLEVEAYKLVQEKKRHHEHWSKIMQSGNTVRANEKIIVDYSDGRILGQRPVTPLFIDSTNWGSSRNSDSRTNGPCEAEQA
ncbi:MAG TPA: hypothetical protein DEF42_10470 [Desulfosporosinus sp.]|nr:hypothetical protein [Desulfosporosinus sp.]